MAYLRFGAMVATSAVVMFGLMYLNTYALDHVLYSQTRMWLALLMGAAMAIIMLLFMWGMYKNHRINVAILAGSAVLVGVSLWLVRSQETVGDVACMKAMVPHHSIASMSSERAHLIAALEREPIAANAPDLAPRSAQAAAPQSRSAPAAAAATPRER